MRKYVLAWIFMLGLVFVAAGSLMMFQGIQAKGEVKANILAEKLVTTEDASIPNVAVDSPETLVAMRDIIREHTLTSTNGLTYSELPRNLLDENGNPVLDANGKPIANPARTLWINSTTLQTALMQGYMAWKLADLVVGLGTAFIFLGLAAMITLLLPKPPHQWRTR